MDIIINFVRFSPLGWAVIEGLVGENMAESIWSLINTSELKKNEKPKDTDDAVPTAWSDGELSSEMLVELYVNYGLC